MTEHASPAIPPLHLHRSPLRWRLLLWAAISAVFTSVVVQFSIRNGRLVLPPAYDDIGYFADGASRLVTFYAGGLLPVFKQYAHNPPHAPYSTFMAVLGFIIFGIRDWAPYAINGLLLIVYLAMADHLLRGLRPWQKGLGIAVMLTVPLTVMSVHEFRPDHASALLTVIGGFVILERPLVTASLRRKAFIGLIFGLALVAKPSTCPATIAMFLGTLVLGAVTDMLITRRLPLLTAAKSCGLCTLVAVAVALPHYLVAYHEIYSYIYDNVFGYRAGIWKTKGSVAYLLTYYIDPGDDNNGGGQMLGRHVLVIFMVLLASVAATAAFPTRKGLFRGAALFLFVVGTYAVVTANPDKTVYFGLTFQTAAMFLMLAAFRQTLLVQRLRTPRLPWATALLMVSVIGGVGEFRWPRRIGEAYAPDMTARRDIAAGVYRAILDSDPLPHSTVLIEGLGDINPDLFNYYCTRDQHPWEVTAPVDTDKLDVHMEALKHADILILSEPGTLITADFLLGYRVLPALDDYIATNPNWQRIGYFVYPPSHHGIFVYKRRRFEFAGWSDFTGLGPAEGPYPELHLPAVRWGVAPATTLTFTAPPQPVEFHMEFRNGQAREAMTVSLDDRQLFAKTYLPAPEFQVVRLPLDVKPGSTHKLTITYSEADDSPDLKRTVLLREMAVLPR